ncbi:hypothetical protein [Acidocella sp.]|uniref:hypothetical protein n=1 Tax=Acidocella sp. TaxID=50710 RepID=UPI003CFE63B7
MIDNKYGVGVGVAWQDRDYVRLFREPTVGKDGLTKMVVVENFGPVRPNSITSSASGAAPKFKSSVPKVASGNNLPSTGALAFDTVGVAADAFSMVLAYSAVTVAFAAITEGALTTGAVALVAFTGFEFLDSLAMLFADGIMTMSEYYDRASGNTKLENAVKNNWYYDQIETWGPVLALPALGKDIADFRKLRQVGADLKDLRQQMGQSLGILATEWVQYGDQEVLAHMKRLNEFVDQVEDNAKDIAHDLSSLKFYSSPLDLFSIVVDFKNGQDIYDGMRNDFEKWFSQPDGKVSEDQLRHEAMSHFSMNPRAEVGASSMQNYRRELYRSTNYAKFHVYSAKLTSKK